MAEPPPPQQLDICQLELGQQLEGGSDSSRVDAAGFGGAFFAPAQDKIAGAPPLASTELAHHALKPTHDTNSDKATAPSKKSTIMIDDPHEDMLEVDIDDGGGADSAIGDLTASVLSQSVNSSIYKFIEENGRTYHSYKEGQYFMPNDEHEQERLDLQHQLFLLTFNNKLHLSPTSNLHDVLDIGTGTGIWCIDFALRNPSAHVVGIDLSPIQPEFVPHNCSFEIEDAEDPWVFPQKFDLIHGRALVSCFKNPETVISSAVTALKPGGWLEFQDIIMPIRGFDATFEGSAIQRWNQTMLEHGRKIGRDFSYSQRYAQMFEAAGLVDIVERHFVWPTSPWCKGSHMKMIATWAQKDFLDGLEGMTMALLTRVAGMTRDQVTAFVQEVKRDVCNTGIHAYTALVVVMGRKSG